ncbi:MAG: acetyltransferase [Acidimicrobiales bacterium]|jgi:sugar O-acyltransferase (sialic acid O-acetyltransferase NeuD family)|nr:acetyltransferase [Acidimicrobiales bacterium]
MTALPGPEDLVGPYDPEAVAVFGGGGHAKQCIDLLQMTTGHRAAAVVDDTLPVGSSVHGVEVVGGVDALAALRVRGVRLAVNAVGGIFHPGARESVFATLVEAGFAFPVLVHPTAWVEPSAALAAGSQVFAQSYIGSAARIGAGALVNVGVIVNHDCVVGDMVKLSPGAMLAGEVAVGESALVGMGATVNVRLRIGARARVGNGATVVADVPDDGVVRAGARWPARPE